MVLSGASQCAFEPDFHYRSDGFQSHGSAPWIFICDWLQSHDTTFDYARYQ